MKLFRLVAPIVAATIAASLSSPSVEAADSFQFAMETAARNHQVPIPLVEAIAYVNSRWEPIPQPASNGGFGPMNIRPDQLPEAEALSGHGAAAIETDPSTNLDAGAALLGHHHGAGSDFASWAPAVEAVLGRYAAVEVFQALQDGESRTTAAGESITLPPQPVTSALIAALTPAAAEDVQAPLAVFPDYPGATWVPASPANYTVANRPHDYGVDMIVIHDTEGSFGSTIQEFQDPAAQVSAHYVVSDHGDITQMVAEKDVAWHAGNWYYNTRAIGIEHEGYAYSCCWYTTAMYQASAKLAASICSRWGVPMDRQHVIGHSEVPDPDNPGQFGGDGHHTDPGPYWDWTTYMSLAQGYANGLPSLPRMEVDPIAVESGNTATVYWQPAHSCHAAITGYSVVSQPGGVVVNLPATATSATFSGLQGGVTYKFTVTATDSSGTDSLTSNAVPWGKVQQLTGPLGSGPAVASWSSDRFDLLFRRTDGQLGHQVTVGSTLYAPESLGGETTSAPAAISWGPDRIDVFARGTDYQLWHRVWTGAYWAGWEPLGGVLTSAPAVASWSENRLDVFVRGTDNALYHRVWDGTGWSGWESLGGVLTSAPGVVSWGPNRIDVFARGTDNQLWHRVWTGSYWANWEPLGGSLGSAPTVASWSVNRLDVFASTSTGSVQHQDWNGFGWSGWQTVGAGQARDDSAAVSWATGKIDLFTEGVDASAYHLVFWTP